MGTRSPSWVPGLIDRKRQRVREIAFGGLTFKASQITNLWLEEWRHAARRSSSRKKVPLRQKRSERGADPTIVSIRNTAPFSVLCSPSLPVLPQPVCRLVSKLLGRRSRNQPFWRWRMPTSAKRNGTKGIRSSIWPKALQIRLGWSATLRLQD